MILFRWKRKLQNVTQSMVDACILEEISSFFSTVLTQATASASGKKSPVERKSDGTPVSAGPTKRPRHSLDVDDSSHSSALSGHNYSQRLNQPYSFIICFSLLNFDIIHFTVLILPNRGKAVVELDSHVYVAAVLGLYKLGSIKNYCIYHF